MNKCKGKSKLLVHTERKIERFNSDRAVTPAGFPYAKECKVKGKGKRSETFNVFRRELNLHAQLRMFLSVCLKMALACARMVSFNGLRLDGQSTDASVTVVEPLSN